MDFPLEAQLTPIERAEPPTGNVSGSGNTYILDHNVLDSYRAVNRLLKEGAKCRVGHETLHFRWETIPGGGYRGFRIRDREQNPIFSPKSSIFRYTSRQLPRRTHAAEASEVGSLQALGCQYGRGLDPLDI